MSRFATELEARLDALRQQGLWRELRRLDSPQGPRITLDGRSLLNFSSNDYLGLANHPAVREGALRATERFGAGAGASRLICGSLAPHHRLEAALAAFKGTDAALCFSTGYAAALGTISALVGRGDFVILDKLVHASIVDAARLSGAKLRVFAHNDLDGLEDILKWVEGQRRADGAVADRGSALIVTESVFSMEGDQVPLRELVDLKDRYGAWLMLDEAHATGLYGPNRRGLAEHFGVSERIEVQMGTLGKALGASGGYICGSRSLIDYLVNRARSFVFSTAPVPAAAGAAEAALEVVASRLGAELVERLWARVAQLPGRFKSQSTALPSAIVPLVTGSEQSAVNAAAALREDGIFIPAVRYPTVPRGKARLRLTLSAAHTEQDLALLIEALDKAAPPA